MHNVKILDSVLQYREKGFPIIPMSPESKRPLVAWTEFQNRLPTESEIQSWWEKHPEAMCGIVTGQLSGCAVVDCDSPEACAKVDEMLPESFETPIAESPRGGRHYYFKCPNGFQTKAAVMANVDIRANGGVIVCPPSTNKQGKHYRWLDGCELSKDSLQEMPASLLCTLKGAPLINNINKIRTIEGVDTFVDTSPLFSEGRRDNDLFTLANSLVKSGMPEGEIFKYLEFIMHSWGEHDETWIKAKIQSALKQNFKREKSLSEDIREYVLSTKGVFLSADVHKNLDLSTRVHRKNCSEVLRRLIAEGIIERWGNKDGCFRRLEKDYEVMKLTDVSVKPLTIQWPFGIHEKVYILPKSIAVIAGQTNAGKTAFALNFAYLNRNISKLRYLTSEMGCQEIRDRVSKMDVPVENWNQIEFIERSSQFQDLVLPDGITIIDYMEKAENFYEIAKDIKNIFDRLKAGFCLIAIQKKAGQDFGRGGDFSAEKARLYLSMSPGKLKIIKAKNWLKSDVNPNGLECDFNLVNGIKFIQKSGWKKLD